MKALKQKIPDICTAKKTWDESEPIPKCVSDRLLQLLDERVGTLPRSRSLFDSVSRGEPQTESVQQGAPSFLDNVNRTIVEHPDVTDLVATAMDTTSQM